MAARRAAVPTAAAAEDVEVLSEEEQARVVEELRLANERSQRMFSRFMAVMLVVLAGIYFVISATELVYEQAEAIAAMEAGLLPPSGAAIVLSNAAAIVAFLACSLRLSLPPTTRWPLWLATVATLGPVAYWAVQYRTILPVLGHYFLLPFVPLPMLAITVYSVWSATATARQIDELSTLMYKTKSS